MAFVNVKWCSVCDAETSHCDGVCSICAERTRRLRRAEWKALTSEEKIDKLLRRIERLEANPLRY